MARVIAVFDGHNDALTREDADRFATGREGGHIDLPRARAGGLAGGIFAVFTPTPGYDADAVVRPGGGYDTELAAPIGQEVAAPHALRTLGRLVALERAGHVRIARAAGDLDAARAAGVLAAVAHLEGAEAIDPGLEALDLFHAAGLRSLVTPLSMGSLAAGACGLMVEVHPDPAKAMSDGEQSLDIPMFAELARRVHPGRVQGVGRRLA